MLVLPAAVDECLPASGGRRRRPMSGQARLATRARGRKKAIGRKKKSKGRAFKVRHNARMQAQHSILFYPTARSQGQLQTCR